MAGLAKKLIESPLSSILFIYAFLIQITLILLQRLLLPEFPVYQSIRTQVQRAYLSSAAIHHPDLPHRMPVTASQDNARQISGDGWTGYLIPGHEKLPKFCQSPAGKRRMVILFAHGGGYARGEARMYIRYMERWRRCAAKQQMEIVFLSVEYGLTPKFTHPTQRNAFLDAYKFLLDEGIHAEDVIFMGDSAGGGICVNAGLEALRRSWPQPAATVLISPWIDMTCSSCEGGNMAVESDYFVVANTAVPRLAKMFVGQKYTGNSPDLNPLYRDLEDVKELSPQLIIAGGAEFALGDAKSWATTCAKAEVIHELVIGWGQLHVWALGSDFIDPSLREATDQKIIGWMRDSRRPGVWPSQP